MMLIKNSLIIFLLSFLLVSETKANKALAVNKIDARLLTNANSVIRKRAVKIEMKESGKAIVDEELTITILNKNADREAIFEVTNDKFSKIKNINGSLYDADGNFVRRIFSEDIHHQLMTDASMLTSDYYIDFAKFDYHAYPFTVNYSYRKVLTGYTNIYNELLTHFHQSAENETIELTTPIFNPIHFALWNTTAVMHLSNVNKEIKTEKWSFENLPALIDEPMNEEKTGVLPTIIIAPEKIKMDEYEGSLISWNEFGKWTFSLYNHQDILPENSVKYFQQLTAHANSDKEKIKILYQYLQQHCRYVSIQLGIGGFQPINAIKTDATKFGDCKGLSNYMKAMLNAVSIKSNIVIVGSGENTKPLDEQHVCNQFNHVILCVPNNHDTIWLECTSTDQPFGKLGAFTENRKALLISEDGGFLVNTPKSKSSENTFHSFSNVKINAQENVAIALSIYATGDETECIKTMKEYLGGAYFQNLLSSFWGLNNYELKNADCKILPLHLDTLLANLDLSKPNSEWIHGNRFFLPTQILKNNFLENLIEERNTNQSIRFPFLFESYDTIKYNIPNGYTVEAMNDADLQQKNNWITLEQKNIFQKETNSLLTINHLVLNKLEVVKNEMPDFFASLKEVKKNLNHKIVLIKSD